MIICQFYLSPLLDLTIAEKTVIAKAHPVLKIFKLKPNGKNNPLAYSRIQSHAVVLPQNPRLLLELLSSSSVVIEDNIRIV